MKKQLWCPPCLGLLWFFDVVLSLSDTLTSCHATQLKEEKIGNLCLKVFGKLQVTIDPFFMYIRVMKVTFFTV